MWPPDWSKVTLEPLFTWQVYVKAGGFLESDVFAFDPLPFGISPREAEVMDPQQRLLLEVISNLIEKGFQFKPFWQ